VVLLQADAYKKERLNEINKAKDLERANLELVKDGFSLERTQDKTKKEYYLRAWHKNNPLSIPANKKIGTIVEIESQFMVATLGGKEEKVETIASAIERILERTEIIYLSVKVAYDEAIASQKSAKISNLKQQQEDELNFK